MGRELCVRYTGVSGMLKAAGGSSRGRSARSVREEVTEHTLLRKRVEVADWLEHAARLRRRGGARCNGLVTKRLNLIQIC